MDLKTMSKSELKELAKSFNLENYEELSKVDLLALITKTLGENTSPSEEEFVEEEIKEVKEEVLTKLYENIKPHVEIPLLLKKVWKEHLNRYKLTAEEFLKRYPNHTERHIIETLTK